MPCDTGVRGAVVRGFRSAPRALNCASRMMASASTPEPSINSRVVTSVGAGFVNAPNKFARTWNSNHSRAGGQRSLSLWQFSMAKKIQIVLVDDHLIVRVGLRSLIETQPDMAVVAEASSGEAAEVPRNVPI